MDIVKTVQEMVVESIKHRAEHLIHPLMLSPLQYAHEFKTIGLNLPRRTGKTTALIELQKILPNVALFFTYNSHLKERRDVYEPYHKHSFVLIDEPNEAGLNRTISSTNNPDDIFQTFIWIGTRHD